MIELLAPSIYNNTNIWFDQYTNTTYVGNNPNHSDSWVFGYDDSWKILNASFDSKCQLIESWINNNGINVLQSCGIGE